MIPSEITNLLRIAADDELTESQTQSLESHLAAHPEDREFIAFERRLRSAVGRVMGANVAPAELRSRVEAQLHASSEPLRLVGSAVDRPAAMHGPRPRRIFVPSGLAAGFLLLVGVAVVIGVTGHSDWFDWFTPTRINVSDDGGSLGAPILEHELCARDDLYAQRKFTLHNEAELRDHIANDLHWDITVPDLSSFGYRLLDAGDSTATGSIESIHLRYTNGSTALSVMIEHSLVSELTHSARLEEGHAYRITPTNRQSIQDEEKAYYAWRENEFVYSLVPASVPEARRMAVSMGMPDVTPEEFH